MIDYGKNIENSIYRSISHKEWIEENTRDGWSSSKKKKKKKKKKNWETCEQHITLMSFIKKLEKQFFDDPHKQFMKDPATWQWKAEKNDDIWGLQGSIFTGWETPKQWTSCPDSVDRSRCNFK